ncbi:MAG TPA: heme ABC transporter ATP-binding protein [Chitinophagales bacterium]|nr:heme ABC transporter ATP-binding protein [Chitinophagales bacterium]
MLTAKNITYKVDGKTLLNNVSVSFLPGKMNLVIGPNGSGKSTLIKILSGLLKNYSGEVIYTNVNLHSVKNSALAKIRAVLSQNVEVTFPLKVSDVVMMGRYPHFTNAPSPIDFEACNKALELFGIADMANRDFMTLSGGEKQRVHFARVLAQIWYGEGKSFRYLLLDEPLTFLDIHYQLDFIEKINQFLKQEHVIVVLVVHDLNLALRHADNITLLNNGSILAHGSKTEVLTPENIKTAFRINVEILQDEIRQSRYILF